MREVRVLAVDPLKSAAAEFVSAALLGESWEGALEQVALAAGARGASLFRNNREHKVASVLYTPEIREPVAAFLAGRVPPMSRQTRLNFRDEIGFRFDQNDYTAEDLARDPYYQEFLRPFGYFWHANASLENEAGENVQLSLKRHLKAGPYEQGDARILNTILPELRAGVRVARGVMNAEGAGVARFLLRRGAPVFELDTRGYVLREHAPDEGRSAPLHVLRGRLVAQDRLAQGGLDRAVARATTPPGSPAVVALPDVQGARYLMQIVPVGGRARDIFRATAAVAVLIDRDVPKRGALDHQAIRDAFALTDRETDVALMLASGRSPADIAKHLHIQVDTARDHLKSVFEKTETNRQAELVALLSRLRP